MTASIYGYKYRVEVTFWTRSADGDDWDTGDHWFNFNNLEEALQKANNPFASSKGMIESKVLDMTLGKYGETIWKKDWHNDKVEDYTTIPDFDYHNREYD